MFVVLGHFLCLISTWAAWPTAEEFFLRDAWVREHFPTSLERTPARVIPPKSRAAGMMVWTSLGPVFCPTIPGRTMQIADRKFEHGLYCHAPARVQVFLPGPAKSFSSVVGILTHPDSQGGSVIFPVEVGGKRLYSSAIMKRGQAAAPVKIDLHAPLF
jgi:hypothetical protein